MGDPRISARTGQIVDLKTTFYQNGVPTDPFMIRRVDIYQSCQKPENLVATIPISTGTGYPSPLLREPATGPVGQCGTEPPPGANLPGVFILPFMIPETFRAPQVYIDVWRFLGKDPGSAGIGTDPDDVVGAGDEDDEIIGIDEEEDEDDENGTDNDTVFAPDDDHLWISQSNKFYVFPDSFFADDGLIIPRLGFEALDKIFYKPEIRSLEVGVMPLPLYDYDFNRIAPIIPHLKAFITIETDNAEILVNNQPCRIGVRQGTYKANPFTIQYTLNTQNFLIGTYQYRITVMLPNGETRVSAPFRLTVA
jgi:hypothetical protein